MENTEINMFEAATLAKIGLLNELYSDPEVINKFFEILNENNSYISSLSYSKTNNAVQIQLRKVFYNKMDKPEDGMSFYNIFNQALLRLFDVYADRLTKFDPKVWWFIRSNTNMLYHIARMGTNTVVLYL